MPQGLVTVPANSAIHSMSPVAGATMVVHRRTSLDDQAQNSLLTMFPHPSWFPPTRLPSHLLHWLPATSCYSRGFWKGRGPLQSIRQCSENRRSSWSRIFSGHLSSAVSKCHQVWSLAQSAVSRPRTWRFGATSHTSFGSCVPCHRVSFGCDTIGREVR